MKVLKASPSTVHWGYLDSSIPPVLTIEDGETVFIECVTADKPLMPEPGRGFDILPEMVEIHDKVKKGTGAHIFTGPIFVKGAEVGNVLEVGIQEINIRQNWGWNIFRGYMGTIPENYPYSKLIHIPLDLKNKIISGGNIEFKKMYDDIEEDTHNSICGELGAIDSFNKNNNKNKFIFHFEDKHRSAKLMADDMMRAQTSLIVKNWIKQNIQHFSP